MPEPEYFDNLRAGVADVDEIHARCDDVYPDFEVPIEEFKAAIVRGVEKYLVNLAKPDRVPSVGEIRKFIAELQCHDLYLTLGCARGDEQAWWRFDADYSSLIERLANQLVGRGMDANEVIDSVYLALYGAKDTDGVRQSKFRTYTGRGTLRGWLRSVISHSAVDLYRAQREEVSLDDWSNNCRNVSSGFSFRTQSQGGESSMVDNLLRERYRSATMAALDEALSTLDAHEKLLLLYYHVDGLKLREIAHIVEAPTSAIRLWFQRRKRQGNNPTRIHESTVMRWLENVYKKVADSFRSELKNRHGLRPAEIDICLDIATRDFGPDVGLNLDKADKQSLAKGRR